LTKLLSKVSFCFRYVQIGVASFGSIVDCGSTPGGFSRLTYNVMQWIRKVKVDSWQLKIELKQQKMEMEQNEMKMEQQKIRLEQNEMKMEQQKIRLEQNEMKMEQQKIRLELQKGVWCGYKDKWNTANAKISYNRIMHSSTNMKNPGIGLNTQSGVFTVPVTGVWRVSFSVQSTVTTEQRNWVYIYHNQQKIEETRHYTNSGDGYVRSTGGRELITRAERGDTFHLGTGYLQNYFYYIITCFEFISL